VSFLSRLLRYATKEEVAGASMGQGERWIVAPTRDAAAVLRALPNLFPAGAFAYFEGTTEEHFAGWLSAHSVASPLKVAYGTIWPKPDFYHLPLRGELLEEAAELVERERIPLPSIHFHVHDGAQVLLEWHDAFGDDPISLAGILPHDRVEEFARAIGVNEVTRDAT
jgi:hypothetical protein